MKNITLLLLLSLPAISLSAQPDYFNYQGLLKDSDGNPLANADYTMEFNIYDNFANGNSLWGPFIFDDAIEEGHSKQVQIANGQFNIILGPIDTSGRNLSQVFSGDSAYVEFKVNGGDPILPRQRILSSPYSFVSTSASTLDYLPPVQFRNPPGMMVPFAGTADKIPAGWLLCDGTEYVTTDHPDLFEAIGKTWGGRQEVAGEVTVDYFNVPDMRGMFLRGANNGRTDGFADPNAGTRVDGLGASSEDAGTLQTDSIPLHRHVWGDGDGNDLQTWFSNGNKADILHYEGSLQIENGILSASIEDNYLDVESGAEVYTKPGSTVIESGESRPNNAAVNYIIKI